MPITTIKPNLTLLDVRKKFVLATKRYDLITNGDIATAADNGADYFINMAQRWLDAHIEHPYMFRRYKAVLATTTQALEVAGMISITSLILLTSDERKDLTKSFYPYDEFRKEIGSVWLADRETGEPTFWTISNAGHASATVDTTTNLDAAGIGDFKDIFTDATTSIDWGSDYIVFDKLAGIEYNIDITGVFYSKYMTTDTDKSYWTVEQPHLLVLAASMILEMQNGNSSRVEECRRNLELMAKDVDDVIVQRELQVKYNRISF